MRTDIERLLDINPSKTNIAYKRSLTVSLLCACKLAEEITTPFLIDGIIYEATKNRNLYDQRDCVNLIEFIRN